MVQSPVRLCTVRVTGEEREIRSGHAHVNILTGMRGQEGTGSRSKRGNKAKKLTCTGTTAQSRHTAYGVSSSPRSQGDSRKNRFSYRSSSQVSHCHSLLELYPQIADFPERRVKRYQLQCPERHPPKEERWTSMKVNPLALQSPVRPIVDEGA